VKWEGRPLSQISDSFADGDWIESKDQSPEGIRLIQTGNIGEGAFKERGEKARFISASTFQRLRCTEIFEGDCLISRLPEPVGRACLLPNIGSRAITAVDCTIVRFDSMQILPEFFNFYSRSEEYLRSVEHHATGTTRKRISRKKLGEIRIPIPPLKEQERIVRILDEAFDGIATAKANIHKSLHNSGKVLESYLDGILARGGRHWIHARLGDVTRFIDYRGRTPKKTVGGLRLITAKNVKKGRVQDAPREFVSPSSYETWMTRGIPKRGDILFTTEAPLGNVAQLDTDDKVVFAQRIIILQSEPATLNSTLVKYLLLAPCNQAQIQGKGTGATATGIKASLLKTVELFFPENVEEQAQIVSTLDALSHAIENLQSIYQQKLAALDALKKSLLHETFSGNL
jgi:type I restriction enzyme S subunit